MNKTNNLRAYLRDLYEGIVSKKPDASRNPQNFRSEIESIRTGGEFYEVMDASELPLDAPDGSLAIVEVEGGTGGGGSVEGTAIPVGVAPQRVYFNLNNTIEQTNAYLSQLTYVQTDLFEYPICGICGYLLGETPVLMFAVKIGATVTPIR